MSLFFVLGKSLYLENITSNDTFMTWNYFRIVTCVVGGGAS